MKPVRVELAHRANYGVRRGKIEWIVMHYTANDGDSGMSNARYFQKALNPVASAHYFVDDREIVQSVPDEYVAYHCGAYKYRHPFCRNYNSIGIEMCDSKRDGTVKATEQTIRNAAHCFLPQLQGYEVVPAFGMVAQLLDEAYDLVGLRGREDIFPGSDARHNHLVPRFYPFPGDDLAGHDFLVILCDIVRHSHPLSLPLSRTAFLSLQAFGQT